ncbi:MAG TPA: hypothetical protein VET88_11805 [Gammaproteobacteria bacterium]|nr:hypothetical protein [Gammaproteobacteria bacterium]
MIKDKTAAARVARYEAKQRAGGNVRVSLFIPESQREKLLQYAEKLRAEHQSAS